MLLRWDDVDLERGLLRIRSELGKTKQERAGRTMPIAPVLRDEMATWGRREGWLIETNGSKREPHRGVTHAVWKRAGVPEEVWSQPCHAFRHGFISELARAEVPEFIIQRLVGHSTGVTGDTYMDPWSLIERMSAAVATVPKVRVHDVSEIRSGFAVIGGR